MVSRATRLSDTLETLHDRPFEPNDVSNSRTIHKSELQAITARLDIPVDVSSPTTADYRTALRSHVDALSNSKSAETMFSTSEIQSIGRALTHASLLDATAVVPFLESCRDAGVETITVNGVSYTVTEYQEEHDSSAPGYEGYIYATFETDKRLIGFYDWDSNGCYYNTSAALEKQTGHIPYLSWKKDTYITNLHTPEFK